MCNSPFSIQPVHISRKLTFAYNLSAELFSIEKIYTVVVVVVVVF